MNGDLIVRHGDFRVEESKYDFTFNVICQRAGKSTFRVIFEDGNLADTRDGVLLKRFVPHVAVWAETALRLRANAMKTNSPEGQKNVIDPR